MAGDLTTRIGETLGASRWYEIGQPRIDTFADVTEDWQFIHLDAARAAAETPFGGTVAHGYLTLSMLSTMAYDVLTPPEGMRTSLNSGFDRLRFLAPVPAGSRLRAVFVLTGAEEKGPGRLLLHLGVTIEIEHHDTPAVVADWLVMYTS